MKHKGRIAPNQVPRILTEPLIQTELAWAAGFFDGEGNVSTVWSKTRGQSSIRLRIHQVDTDVLFRFKSAVGGLGKVYGPYMHGGVQPIYQYAIDGFEGTQAVMGFLWKYLSPVKKKQFNMAWDEFMYQNNYID